MKRLGMEEGEAIEAKMLSGAIERAQRKVEVRNFDIRKHLLEYDNVMNKQRESIYGWRRNVLGTMTCAPSTSTSDSSSRTICSTTLFRRRVSRILKA